MNVREDRSNNFDAIRLLGAVLVLVGHSYPLHGRTDNPAIWGASIQVVGLVLFFSISGYLIAKSWDRDPHFLPYIRKRALRIFPALVVVVLASMFVLGPALSRLPISEYFSNSNLWLYLKNIVLSPVYALPGVFETTPIPNAVNGSLWSLPAEFACYLLVPLAAVTVRRFRSAAFIVLALSAGVFSIWLTSTETRLVIYGTDIAQATSIWPFFLVGAAIATAGRWLPIRLDLGVVALVTTSLLTAISPQVGLYFSWFALPYATISFGTARTPVVRRAGRFGDISYGLYLYAFPTQQALLVVAPSMPQAISTLLALLIATVCAVGSWHFVEKWALKFKPQGAAVLETPVEPKPANRRDKLSFE